MTPTLFVLALFGIRIIPTPNLAGRWELHPGIGVAFVRADLGAEMLETALDQIISAAIPYAEPRPGQYPE